MGGFPKDDEYSKVAGCCGDFPCNCSTNLDIFYPHQFVRNEEVANAKNGIVCRHKLEHTPVLKNCTVGTVYYDQIPLCIFHDKEGVLVFKELKAKEQHPDKDFPSLVSGSIAFEDGVISLTWDRKIDAGKSCVVTSYEYNLECQYPEPVECPKCKHKFCPGMDAVDDIAFLQKLAEGEGTLDIY